MPRPTVNLAAGRRFLGARKHSRLLDEQTEVLALSLRGDEIVIAMAPMLGELHRVLRSIEAHARRSNEIATEAQYEPPAVASMSRPRNERRTAERRGLAFA